MIGFNRISAKGLASPELCVCTHLLVKKGPEHGQRDEKKQHPQHHLDLPDQTLLLRCRRTDVELNCPKNKSLVMTRAAVTGYSSSAQSNQCFLSASCFDLRQRFLMANCRNQEAKSEKKTKKTPPSCEPGGTPPTPMHLQTRSMTLPCGGFFLYMLLPAMKTTAEVDERLEAEAGPDWSKTLKTTAAQRLRARLHRAAFTGTRPVDVAHVNAPRR